MKKLEWSPRLSLSVVELDAQHRRLLDLANTLTEAVQMGAEGLVVERILDELTDYALTHFRDEERYMERVEFPERSGHAKEHGRFARQIAANLAGSSTATICRAFCATGWLNTSCTRTLT